MKNDVEILKDLKELYYIDTDHQTMNINSMYPVINLKRKKEDKELEIAYKKLLNEKWGF